VPAIETGTAALLTLLIFEASELKAHGDPKQALILRKLFKH
jgi:hypothetical protein